MRRLLHEHGLAPRKAAGQNFVVDPNTVRRIVRESGVGPGDVVLEVGPGVGSLTLALADAASRVVAVEIDAGLVEVVRDVVADRGRVEVVHADALRADLGALVGGGPARLVANLPYNLATPIVVHALEEPAVSELFVMVQREVGERWGARVGDRRYSGLSLKLALLAEVEVVFTISRNVFFPVPNVDSVMVRLRRLPEAPPPDRRERCFRLVELAFSQRRKTLRNTLRELGEPEQLERIATEAGVDLGARAETLSVDDLLRLEAAVSSRTS